MLVNRVAAPLGAACLRKPITHFSTAGEYCAAPFRSAYVAFESFASDAIGARQRRMCGLPAIAAIMVRNADATDTPTCAIQPKAGSHPSRPQRGDPIGLRPADQKHFIKGADLEQPPDL